MGGFMQALGIRLAATAAICVMASAAQAGPKLNGKYAFHATTFCAGTLRVFKDTAVKQVQPNGSTVIAQYATDVATTQGGMISANIGYITFNSPITGQATITGSTLVEGAALRVQGKSSFLWASHSDNQSGVPFSINAAGTVFTFGGEQYQMVFADPVEGNPSIYRTAYLMRRSTADGDMNPDCVTTVQATRQAD
jgi:hypothetical protein